MFGQSGTLILVRSRESSERLAMYEFTTPYLRSEKAEWLEIFTSEQARYPLIAMVICATAFYQLYWKKGAVCYPKKDEQVEQKEQYAKDDPRRMLEGMRDQARKKGKYTPKMEKSLGELETMF
mmetsp:Transcript_8340/g.9678  ORF Transcript_8340/g.9678 Transcript_8340/m.9678 type:complete len:123 (+) Transcript_8340:1430-1798(+)